MEDASRSGFLKRCADSRRSLLLGFLAIALIALAGCGGSGAQVDKSATPTPPYGKVWAAEQVVAVLKETYQADVAHDWAALYNLYEDGDKTGCSQDAFVARMGQIYAENQATWDQAFQKKLQAVEDTGIRPSKITEDRISYLIAEGPQMTVGAIALQNGKWVMATTPLGQDCSQIVLPFGILQH
jgi:hypothetical protein